MVGMQNGTVIMENRCVVSQKIKNKITIWSRNSTSEYISKVIESRVSKRYLYSPVHSSIINNSQKVGASQLSICDWMDKQNVVHTHNKVKVKLLSRVQLHCDPMDLTYQAPLSMVFSRQEILEWVAISFSRGSSQPRDWTRVSCITGRHFTIWATREALNKEGNSDIYYSMNEPWWHYAKWNKTVIKKYCMILFTWDI